MATAADYLNTQLARHVLGSTSFTKPTTLRLALFTTNVNRNGTGTEVTGGGYSRQPITFTEVVPGEMANNSLSFTNMPAVSVRGLAIMTAASGGNMLYFVNFSPVSVGAGNTYPVNAGVLVVRHGDAL